VAEELLPNQSPDEQPKIPEVLPVLPLRDVVVYPYVILPLSVSREKSIRAVDTALVESRMILLLSQRQMEIDDPSAGDMHQVGTAALIMRVLKLPDGRIRALVQGLQRVRVEYFTESEQLFRAKVEPLMEPEITERTIELDALMRNVKQTLEKAVALGSAGHRRESGQSGKALGPRGLQSGPQASSDAGSPGDHSSCGALKKGP
jgi:ATP-dependent Lon protease